MVRALAAGSDLRAAARESSNARVKAMACQSPEERDVPQAQWSAADLAAQAVAVGLAESVSTSTVRRWLDADAVRPWRYRSWIFPRDPHFAERAGAGPLPAPVGWRRAGENEYVISSDEKPGDGTALDPPVL